TRSGAPTSDSRSAAPRTGATSTRTSRSRVTIRRPDPAGRSRPWTPRRSPERRGETDPPGSLREAAFHVSFSPFHNGSFGGTNDNARGPAEDNMRATRIGAAIIALTIASLVIGNAAGSTGQKKASNNIVIGFAVGETGFIQPYDIPGVNSWKLVINAQN